MNLVRVNTVVVLTLLVFLQFENESNAEALAAPIFKNILKHFHRFLDRDDSDEDEHDHHNRDTHPPVVFEPTNGPLPQVIPRPPVVPHRPVVPHQPVIARPPVDPSRPPIGHLSSSAATTIQDGSDKTAIVGNKNTVKSLFDFEANINIPINIL